MTRRKVTQVGDHDLEKSLVPFNSDMEVDSKEAENLQEEWLWEKEFLKKEDDNVSSLLDTKNKKTIEECEDDYDAAAIKTLDDVKQKGICSSYRLKPLFNGFNIRTSSAKKGESSWSTCLICGEDKPAGKLKENRQCGHFFCLDCMRVYVGKKIQENGIHNKVKCPQEKCNKRLCFQEYGPFIPDEVYDRIADARRESKVLANPTFMECPFLFCSAKFVDDKKGFKIKACPVCWRLFCVECGVLWHMGKSCEQFQAELQAQAQAQARDALTLYRSQLLDDLIHFRY